MQYIKTPIRTIRLKTIANFCIAHVLAGRTQYRGMREHRGF